MIQNRERLVASCGLFCGACRVYVARKRDDKKRLEQIAREYATRRRRPVELIDLVCEGCLSDRVAFFCGECSLRSCAVEKGVYRCARCQDFPCQEIINFNDDGRPHHSEVLNNIERQKEIGINKWIEEQNERWSCSNCGCPVDWYTNECPECNTPLLNHF